jgi:shikimate kinase
MVPPLFLTGMMGSGKSTVGRLLAHELGVPFIDLDRRIERLFGASIEALFASGEDYFRSCERAALVSLCAEPAFAARRSVVATGGGVVIDAANRADMAAHGVVIHLDVPIDELARRVEREGGRPLLGGSSITVRRRLADLLAARGQAYRDAAVSVDARGAPELVAARVRDALGQLESDGGDEASWSGADRNIV